MGYIETTTTTTTFDDSGYTKTTATTTTVGDDAAASTENVVTTTTTGDDPVSTENVATPHQCTIIHVSRSVKPTDLFLTLASNNTRAMSFYVSEVKNACNEFATDVCALVEYEEDYDDTDSDYSDSSDDSDSEIDPDSALTKKILANEFEPIIADLKNMIQSLEQRYLAAKDSFNCCMSKEMENFNTSYPTTATGM